MSSCLGVLCRSMCPHGFSYGAGAAASLSVPRVWPQRSGSTASLLFVSWGPPRVGIPCCSGRSLELFVLSIFLRISLLFSPVFICCIDILNCFPFVQCKDLQMWAEAPEVRSIFVTILRPYFCLSYSPLLGVHVGFPR